MSGNFDWVIVTSGWVLLSVGSVGVLWSLFWDRARGRRRCPKCWYDLSATAGLQCPECGRDARRERRLFRTRRRWKWAVIGTALMLVGHAVTLVPRVRKDGWWAAAPRIVLIAALPLLDSQGSMGVGQRTNNALFARIIDEFHPERCDPRSMWPWERWLAEPIAYRVLAGGSGSEAKMVAAWFYATLDDRAVERAPESARGTVIIAKTATTYAQCRTCMCIGQTREGRFIVASEKATGGFRFEYLADSKVRDEFRYLVWRNELGAFSWWTLRPDIEQHQNLYHALAVPYGVCARASGCIPELLNPQPVSSVGICDLVNPAVPREEDMNGRPCWRIDTRWWTGGARTIWIDRETYFLVRADDEHYETQINIPVDPDLFKFDPAAKNGFKVK